MDDKILIVDDDQKLLIGYKRVLDSEFNIELAYGPEEGLTLLDGGTRYAVILADMSMPVMNGVEFLKHSKRITPSSIRMMLTGNSDVETAISAVNEGNIFRFLTKPCPSAVLKQALKEGLEEYRLQSEKLHAAMIDGLTGLYNRRYLDVKMNEESEKIKRYGVSSKAYTVIFMDLDNFKFYNDRFGHHVGDLLLREFAAVIKKEIRTVDFAARYGGDEFVLLLPETDISGAVVIAKRIRETLKSSKGFQSSIEELLMEKVVMDDSSMLGCSIGISGVLPGEDISSALAHADESVLEAKRSGKDCFVIWQGRQ